MTTIRDAVSLVPEAQHRPLLAYLEQRARQAADLQALRAIRDYRRMLEEEQPTKS